MSKESKIIALAMVCIMILSIIIATLLNQATKETIIIELSFENYTLPEEICEEQSFPPIPSSTELYELGKTYELEKPTQQLEGKELYFSYVDDICKEYSNVEPSIIKAMMFKESSYNPDAISNTDSGLMQVSTRWHKDRAEKLGVDDFFDPYSNILLGVDYLSELLDANSDIYLALMLYNMKHEVAFERYNNGDISDYALSVVELSKEFR